MERTDAHKIPWPIGGLVSLLTAGPSRYIMTLYIVIVKSEAHQNAPKKVRRKRDRTLGRRASQAHNATLK